MLIVYLMPSSMVFQQQVPKILQLRMLGKCIRMDIPMRDEAQMQ